MSSFLSGLGHTLTLVFALETLEKYDPEKDIALTGARVPFVIEQLE